MVLTGGTYLIREDLKALGARYGDAGWSLDAGKFDAVAGLCARAGLALAPARAAA